MAHRRACYSKLGCYPLLSAPEDEPALSDMLAKGLGLEVVLPRFRPPKAKRDGLQTQPCPCGFRGTKANDCRCDDATVAKYNQPVSADSFANPRPFSHWL